MPDAIEKPLRSFASIGTVLAGGIISALLIAAAPADDQLDMAQGNSKDQDREVPITASRMPAFLIDHLPLAEFLEWAAQETGRELVFTSPDARAAASQLILRGSIVGVDAESALVAVMATTSLKLSEPPGRIVIGVNTL